MYEQYITINGDANFGINVKDIWNRSLSRLVSRCMEELTAVKLPVSGGKNRQMCFSAASLLKGKEEEALEVEEAASTAAASQHLFLRECGVEETSGSVHFSGLWQPFISPFIKIPPPRSKFPPITHWFNKSERMMEERRRLLAAQCRPAMAPNPEMCGQSRLISGQPVKWGEVSASKSATATVEASTPSSARATDPFFFKCFSYHLNLSSESLYRILTF